MRHSLLGQSKVQKVVSKMQFSCVYVMYIHYTVISDVELNNCCNYK